MKVIIAGSRTLDDKHAVYLRRLTQICEKFEHEYGTITQVVSGRARGPDKIGEKWAIENGISIAKFPAQWDKHGKAAGPIRNGVMGNFADAAIILWDGKSNGAKHMADTMRKLGKPYIIEVIEPITEFSHQPNGVINKRYG